MEYIDDFHTKIPDQENNLQNAQNNDAHINQLANVWNINIRRMHEAQSSYPYS